MKKITALLLFALLSAGSVKAQTNTFPASGNVGIGTISPTNTLHVNGSARFGNASSYGYFDVSGNLRFGSNASLRIAANKYVFQFSEKINYGLYFNATKRGFEFRDSNALASFYVSADTGNGVFRGGVQIGNSTVPAAGTLRWTGTNFEGYNGTAWLKLHGYLETETDPQVGSIATSYIPRWSGTSLTTGAFQDNGSRIGLNKTPDTKHRFTALRQQTSGSFITEVFSSIRGENNQNNSTTINSVGYLGMHNPAGIYQLNFPNTSIADVGVMGVKTGTDTEGAGVVAFNFGTATNNYGLYSAASGNTGNKYGIYSLASGGGNVNRGLYVKAEGATLNYAITVPEDGGKSGFGWNTPSATLGVKANGTDDAFKVINNSFSTKFLVSKNGNVGINTSNTDVELNISGTDKTVVVDGSNPYIQMNNGGALTGYVRADGSNMQIATNAENDFGKLEFRTNGSSRMWIDGNGNVAVGGAGKVATGYMMSVAGKLIAEEVRVELNGTWPDYVFNKDYKLMKLSDLKNYIAANNHLPEIPTAEEMKNGVDVGKINKLLMQKVEELTLYVIKLNEDIEKLKLNNK